MKTEQKDSIKKIILKQTKESRIVKESEIEKVLTPEQISKYKAMKKEMKKEMKKNKKEMRKNQINKE